MKAAVQNDNQIKLYFYETGQEIEYAEWDGSYWGDKTVLKNYGANIYNPNTVWAYWPSTKIAWPKSGTLYCCMSTMTGYFRSEDIK
jgi:hypothetical protein